MRHALAPGTGDPAEFTLGDCATQRNLDARGRAQARAIGAAFRERGLAVDGVYTSQWCRCRETAALLELGEPQDLPALNSFFADRSTRDAQTRAVRAFLADRPAEARLVLVTHFVNIRALTGRGVRSGEIVVIDTDAEGDVQVLGEIRISA
jgi:broad specificity phosphatase PhoE